jgi:hypothetical protein
VVPGQRRDHLGRPDDRVAIAAEAQERRRSVAVVT